MSFEGHPTSEGPKRLERHGLRATVPVGWECRIGNLPESGDGERTFSYLHASTVPLTGPRADYGGGVVERLGSNDVFVALLEFGPEEASSALFGEVDEMPVLEQSMFRRNQLQRRIRGQAGVQRFFTFKGRPFCLYVVLGSIVNSAALVEKANQLVLGLGVDTS